MKPGTAPLIVLLPAWLGCGPVAGHPLGNNTVNRQALILVAPRSVDVRYLIDLAEIPTLLAAQAADLNGSGTATDAAWDAYARQQAQEILAGIELAANGRPLGLTIDTVRWQREAGAAGLDTLRLTAVLSAPLPEAASVHLRYRDRRRAQEVGWKEVVAQVAPGVERRWADVPETSPSLDLTRYPSASAAASPQVVAAELEVEPAQVPPAQSVTARTDPDQTRTPLRAAATGAQAGAFFRLGIFHIATGLDHLVFLLGLLAAAWSAQHRRRRLLWVVTAFTLAHSLTLGLAAADLIAVPGAWIGPAIGLTIAYVGLANLLGGLRQGPWLAFAFGLVHGLGFAGALTQGLAGVPVAGGSWLLDLAAFNLGIEAAQCGYLLIALLTWQSLRILEVRPSRALAGVPAAAVGVLGIYWTLQPALLLIGGP